MARDRDHLADSLDTENSGGWLTGFLAEEDSIDRRSLWRLGSWGVGSVGAVIVALLANQSSIKGHRDQIASTDLVRQSQQIQWVARESQSEARRLASAINTLNGDRDRLYSRVTVLEQGLDTVTGSIGRQNSAAGSPQASPKPVSSAEPAQTASQNPVSPPVITATTTIPATTTEKTAPTASVTATPATPLMASKSMLAPPDPAAAKLSEPGPPSDPAATAEPPDATASISAAPRPDSAAALASLDVTVQRTEFGVDLGGANSIGGLRALWRGLLKSNNSLAALRPIIVLKERSTKLGMQLRLVAGPVGDAAAAARICAGLGDVSCETSVFDGQRLAMTSADPPPPVSVRPPRKRSSVKRVKPEEPAPKPKVSALSSILSTR